MLNKEKQKHIYSHDATAFAKLDFNEDDTQSLPTYTSKNALHSVGDLTSPFLLPLIFTVKLEVPSKDNSIPLFAPSFNEVKRIF